MNPFFFLDSSSNFPPVPFLQLDGGFWLEASGWSTDGDLPLMIPADRQLANWRSQLDMIKGDDFFGNGQKMT